MSFKDIASMSPDVFIHLLIFFQFTPMHPRDLSFVLLFFFFFGGEAAEAEQRDS